VIRVAARVGPSPPVATMYDADGALDVEHDGGIHPRDR
jgi:hypothetical protein